MPGKYSQPLVGVIRRAQVFINYAQVKTYTTIKKSSKDFKHSH